MMLQTIIVLAIIAGAVLYAGSVVYKKRRAFSVNSTPLMTSPR